MVNLIQHQTMSANKYSVKLVVVVLTLFMMFAANSTELLTLQNERIRFTVAPKKGGELSGFEVKVGEQFHQLLYRANDYSKQKGWRGKSLFLWPATGPTKKVHQLGNKFAPGHYSVQGKDYPMPFHGFAGRIAWQVISQHKASIQLQLQSNQKSKKYYPFDFKLNATYTLLEDGVEILYAVKSLKSNTLNMPFSIGNHATFKAPLLKNSELADFKFSTTCTKQMEFDKNNMPTGKVIETLYQGEKLFHELPERKAIPYTDCYKDNNISLIDPSGLTVMMSQSYDQSSKSLPKTPYIEYNLWASKEFGFISPEPWLGAKNSLNSGIGLVSIAPNTSWEWKVKIKAAQLTQNELLTSIEIK